MNDQIFFSKLPLRSKKNLLLILGLTFTLTGFFIGCGLNRDHDFGTGPSKFDTTITALREIDATKPLDTLRVGTLNMSIGFPVGQLLFLNVAIDSIAYKALDTIVSQWRHGRPDQRVKLMAQSIIDQKLDVVGLQEVLVFNLNDTLTQDFYKLLKSELEFLSGAPWSGTRKILNDTLLNANWDGRSLKVGFAEGNALLVRKGLTLSDTVSALYKTLLPIELEGAKPSERGFNHALITTTNGSRWSIYNTHLEVFEPFRSIQASELVQELTSTRMASVAQIALGDFNDEPKTGSAQIVAESGMLDAREVAQVPAIGTCCVDNSFLWDSESGFSNRILDYIFVHHVVGALTWNRGWDKALPLPDSTLLWPSDHVLISTTLTSQ